MKKVLAFYYPWYRNPKNYDKYVHWEDVDEVSQKIGSSYNYPKLGAYDSNNPKIITQHIKWAKYHGIDGFIVSWWGITSLEDYALDSIMKIAQKMNFKITVYLEKVRFRKVETATRDLLHLLRRYQDNPSWLKVDNRPVFFIYTRAVKHIGITGWNKVVENVSNKIKTIPYLIANSRTPQAIKSFDSTHDYIQIGNKEYQNNPKKVFTTLLEKINRINPICIKMLTVCPGYDDTSVRKPGLNISRQDGKLYTKQWDSILSLLTLYTSLDWVLVTSWNEWHEGTEIEPSLQEKNKYLKLTARYSSGFKSFKKY